MSEIRFPLGWGNSVAVRKAFLETYNGDMVIFSAHSLERFDYPTHEGDPELVEITKQIIKRQIGKDYKHVFITNGATGGVVIALRMFKQRGYEYVHTRHAPYYIRYPRMINASGLTRLNEEDCFSRRKSLILLDLPSNPVGFLTTIECGFDVPVVLDGVYCNRVYVAGGMVTPRHDIFIGSYSKLLGMNGIRTGWVATNDDLMADRLKDLVASEYCGLSRADTDIIKNTLYGFNWGRFETLANLRLDYNREQWSKLEKYFGDAPVPPVGMFYYAPIDAKCKELLEKSGIQWTTGKDLGTNNSFARFNLGQDCRLIEEAVKTVLMHDQRT